MPISRRPAAAAANLLLLGLLLAGCSTASTLQVAAPPPAALPSERYAAVVADASRGTLLYQVNPDALRYPASLTKMMTLYLLFEAMESGRVSRSTMIPVSDNAARRPPTKIGFHHGDAIDVDSAIRAVVTKSANDVAVAIGEYLGGTEEQFAAMMTAKARALGMRNTVFHNASGLPDDDQHTTARDMAILGMALRRNFPAEYGYFSSQSFNWRGRTVRGHNDLLARVSGVDGIKTGYIHASGYNIVTSVNRGGRKLVVVVMGGDTARARNDNVEALIDAYLPQAAGGGF